MGANDRAVRVAGGTSVNIDTWNEVLAGWFLNEGPHRPVYLSSTGAELQRMNDELRLGVADIEEDLRLTVSRATYHCGIRTHSVWVRSDRIAPPPWLAFLAASVLVVQRQTDAGSTEFYNAFSRFLGMVQRLTQREYEESFFVWWGWLALWLEKTHEGRRGFATWRGIPESGPRSVIGHPYTQVLLRREDRRDLDGFLADFGSEHDELPELTDRLQAGLHLVAALRRWSSGRRMLTTRLRSIIEGGSESSVESLAYMLLDRLFDQKAENQESSARRIAVVPVFDELERELHLAAIAPATASLEAPLVLRECTSPMTAPGQPSFLRQIPTGEMLSGGIEMDTPPDLTLVGAGREVHALARREWDLWCGVRTVEDGEEVYFLAPLGMDARLQMRATRRVVANMPSGWTVYGPGLFTPNLEHRAGVALLAKERLLVPRLRGGAALDSRRNYLVGGEPTVELPGASEPVVVDGSRHAVINEELALNELGLGAGAHIVTAGPFRIPFATISGSRLPDVQVALGRTQTGIVVEASDETGGLIAGVKLLNGTPQRGPARLSPVVDRVTLLGSLGEVATVDVGRAGWADRLTLPRTALELAARSTYANGERVIAFPLWLAWVDESGWTVARWDLSAASGAEAMTKSTECQLWRAVVTEIGSDPAIFRYEADLLVRSEELLEMWRNYISPDASE